MTNEPKKTAKTILAELVNHYHTNQRELSVGGLFDLLLEVAERVEKLEAQHELAKEIIHQCDLESRVEALEAKSELVKQSDRLRQYNKRREMELAGQETKELIDAEGNTWLVPSGAVMIRRAKKGGD